MITLALLLAAQGTLSGVGLGPLQKAGLTDGPTKAFYLTVSNPGRQTKQFRVATDVSGQFEPTIDPARIIIFPSDPVISGERGRKVMVIVRDLKPGEDVVFRVCAEEKVDDNPLIHPRVCSRLNAKRIAARR